MGVVFLVVGKKGKDIIVIDVIFGGVFVIVF